MCMVASAVVVVAQGRASMVTGVAHGEGFLSEWRRSSHKLWVPWLVWPE